jgi:NADPH2:quinone reductase
VPANVPTPTPGAGEVRLRLRAWSINPVDFKFALSGAGLAMPHVLGIDAAERRICRGSASEATRICARC